MKNTLMPIVRTDIAEDIEKNLGKKIILLTGAEGSGKSYIAKAIATNNLQKKYKELIRLKCINCGKKDNDDEIFDYDDDEIFDYNSFLSNILLKTKFSQKQSPTLSQERKVDIFKKNLKETKNRFIFVFDDFDKIEKINEQRYILQFLNDPNVYENAPVIITLTKQLELDLNNYNNCYEKKIGNIDKNNFEKICKKFIYTGLNKDLRNKILLIIKAIGKKEYYDFIREESKNDLCLMHDIQIHLVITIFNEENNKNLDSIKKSFERIKYNYELKRGDLIKKIFSKLSPDEKLFLHAISLFSTEVSKNRLKKITKLTNQKINHIETKYKELYLLDDFIKKTTIHKENEIKEYYSLIRPLKVSLERDRKDNPDKYSGLINNWINFYKVISKKIADKIDLDLSNLDKMEKEFNNISKVLKYCDYEKTLGRWKDYYEISDNIWYFSEITAKDVNNYHLRRYQIAKKIGDNKKIFDSALHFCNISCKKGEYANAKDCFEELKRRIDSVGLESERLSLKYIYTLALQSYFIAKNEEITFEEKKKMYNEAEIAFNQCEDKLPALIKTEHNLKEQRQLVKDYISVVKWHANCFYENINQHNTIKDFEELNDKIERSISYELKYGIDYSRVIVPVLISRIKLLLKYKDKVQNYEQKMIYDFEILKGLYDSTIKEDGGLKEDYEKIYIEAEEYVFKNEIKIQECKKIINKTLNDETQKKILPILQETKDLFLEAIKKVNAKDSIVKVSVTAMPDLGLANNVIRMSGGFFTGMFIEWESEVPFVPIDTTINSCGVAIYQLNKEISVDEFKNCFVGAEEKVKRELDYNWNFQRGNHFISFGKLESGDYCIVMHASADEYKRDMDDKSLYPPEKGVNEDYVWYSNDIHEIYSAKNKHRYLRYLYDNPAKKFISTAIRLETVNHIRMKDIAKCIFGDLIKNEIIFVPHYGMPTSNSIAIGCSWKKNESVLLTAPGKDIYIIKPVLKSEVENPFWLTPHGLGVSAQIEDIKYENGISINNIHLQSLEDVKEIKGRSIRCRNDNDTTFGVNIDTTLSNCNAERKTVIHPIASISVEGFKEF